MMCDKSDIVVDGKYCETMLHQSQSITFSNEFIGNLREKS